MFRFKAGVSYRHILIVKGPYPDMGTAPPHDHTDKDVTGLWNTYLADPGWAALLAGARRILEGHPVNARRMAEGKNPANCIWLWGEGRPPSMPTLPRRFGISGSMISAVDLLKGLGVNAGLSVIDVPGATGYLDTNYQGKAQAALDALLTQDFVFVHVEAPDETGHQGLLDKKIQAIEDFDSRIVAPHRGAAGQGRRLPGGGDHGPFHADRPRTHTSDPVPVCLYDSREKSAGSGLPFSEKPEADLPFLTESHQLIERLFEQHENRTDALQPH